MKNELKTSMPPAESRWTRHAWERMCERGLSPGMVGRVLDYGRVIHGRGARIHLVGKKEIERYRNQQGVDLSDLEGLQVICAPDGQILTVYRNRDLKGLRPRRRARQRRWASRTPLPEVHWLEPDLARRRSQA